MKDWQGGYYILMKITPRVPGDIPPMEIRYRYNSIKVLGFIAIGGSRISEPGDPYLSSFPDNYSNVSVCTIVCPRLICRHLNACN